MKSQTYLRWGEYGESDSEQPLDFWFWIVRTLQGVVLIDSGFDRKLADLWHMILEVSIVEALRSVGASTTDVTTIILSHLHSDHVGNLLLFPHAIVVVQREEWMFWQDPVTLKPLIASDLIDSYRNELLQVAAAGRLRLVDGDVRLTDLIAVEKVGGHTPGSQIVLARDGDRKLLFASDAVHFEDELESDRPFVIVADLPSMYRGFERVRALVADGWMDGAADLEPGARFRAPPCHGARAGRAEDRYVTDLSSLLAPMEEAVCDEIQDGAGRHRSAHP